MDYLLRNYQPILKKSDLIIKNTAIAETTTQQTVNIDIEKLQQMLSSSCHQDISVLLVDYHMPEMQGIDFLNKIRRLPIKKALITGENDYKIGVDAFNAGFVDAYLRKDDPDFSNKIQKIVSNLEWKYFTELSTTITDIADFNFLKDMNFIAAFQKIIEVNEITSFCLVHTQGNFITRNMHGEQKHILVRNKNQLQELAKLAEEDGASKETILNLEKGKVVPFFGTHEYWQIPASKWDKYLYPVTNISGDSDLGYTVISHSEKL